MPQRRPILNVIGILERLNPMNRTGTIGSQPVYFINALDLSALQNKQVLRVRIVQSASAATATRWKVDKFHILDVDLRN
ncbi:MAG: hypothetical protein RJA44_1562 [Pseudomonadota bacterium]|jgi:hypothetical protein